MSDMKEQLTVQQIEIVILTVPASVAQDVTDEIMETGVKGILTLPLLEFLFQIQSGSKTLI